jgi:pimeloyl-ACP methyl ester carboxylesterase
MRPRHLSMHVERAGVSGPLLLLVHGGGVAGWDTWEAQRPLADDYRLLVPHRPGYPPNPAIEFLDFDLQARALTELIEPGTHVVGHSYGGVVSLLAAARVPERVRSLTVIEPPTFGLARARPDVERLMEQVAEIWADRAGPSVNDSSDS